MVEAGVDLKPVGEDKMSFDEDASLEVFAARMIRAGYSYDAVAGIWWKDDNKPGIVETLETQLRSCGESRSGWIHRAQLAELRIVELERDVVPCICCAGTVSSDGDWFHLCRGCYEQLRADIEAR